MSARVIFDVLCANPPNAPRLSDQLRSLFSRTMQPKLSDPARRRMIASRTAGTGFAAAHDYTTSQHSSFYIPHFLAGSVVAPLILHSSFCILHFLDGVMASFIPTESFRLRS